MRDNIYTLTLMCILFVSCSTVKRPDLGVVKNNGKKYEYTQTKLLGLIPMKPILELVPTKMDQTKTTIQKPAKWLLWIVLPASILIAVVGAVAVVYLQNEKLAKLCMVTSIGLFLAALGCVAWLIATTYMWLLIVVIALVVSGGVFALYRLTKGTTPRLMKQNTP